MDPGDPRIQYHVKRWVDGETSEDDSPSGLFPPDRTAARWGRAALHGLIAFVLMLALTLCMHK